MPTREKILRIVLVFQIGLFSFSLFKNIQYPLLWNDEAGTVMYSKSILKYGYPRIFFEGNYITQMPKFELKFLEDPATGAAKEIGWLAPYIAVPFVAIGETTNNIYLKTAIVRLPFVILGIIGILLFGYITTLFVNKKTYKISAFILFMLVVLYNIPLTLHLREARYYSLLLFLLGIYWLILIRFIIFSDIRYRYFGLVIPVISLAVLLTYPPAFIPCIVLLYIVSVLQKGHLRYPTKKSLFPAIITTLISIPIFSFFDILNLARITAEQFHVTAPKVISNISRVFLYLYGDELLISAIVIAVVLFIINFRHKNTRKLSGYFLFCILVIIFCISYIAALSRLPFLFTRYYIYLSPLITIVAIVGLISSVNIFGKKIIFVFLAVIFLYNFTIHNGYEKARRFAGHIYELTHRYEGPIDVIIPYILSHTDHPEKLVIATNYEEFSYMYYLKSRVTFGYVNINLDEDLKIQPDIVIFRPGWETNPKYFNDFLKKDKYDEIIFPIVNYPLNNIPDFNFKYPHQFKTLYVKNENDKLSIFVKSGILN